ncbi:MAG: phospholipid carrier-dependent glycosyltransferase [Fimbriimonadaceae bacterium]|nr:phospholipid carrier-dependent glycosyltransferase [Fimbriimonadaceae bacterium]
MLGLIITGIFCFAVTLGFRKLLNRWMGGLDPQEAFGVSGLVGLGLVGTVTIILGLIPKFLMPGMAIVGVGVLALAVWGFKEFGKPTIQAVKPGGTQFIAVAGLVVLFLLPLVASLAPSTSMDWDSLAYHLAVPKIWLAEGQVTWIQTIHHSNFPFALDSLYLYGLTWGGEAGAKAFNFFILLMGCRALFGMARRWSGERTAIWAAFALAGAPVVLWESGTAYIDVGHGLFAGLGVLYVAEMVSRLKLGEELEGLPILAALSWGLAMGTKLTGLQTFFVAGFLFLVFGFKNIGRVAKPAGLVAGVALLIALPWFIKSASFTGNPVFPFFYEKLGGKGWDQWRADIYKNEQQTFGVGRTETGRDIKQIGHAILGLGYQPGRYVNPGQTKGLGLPTGAIGIVPILVFIFWAVSGKMRPQERFVVAWVGLSMLLWFFLSQQSRYLTFLVVPAAVLAAGGVERLKLGKILAGVVGLQALVSAGILWNTQTPDQLRVATGQVSAEAFRNSAVGFSPIAKIINEDDSVTEVALFDEVFGYLLDKKYFWANPGHSDRIPFERMSTGAELADELKAQNVSHVLLGFPPGTTRESLQTFLESAGIIEGMGWTVEERTAMLENREVAWKVLLAEAIRDGRLSLTTEPSMRGLLFRVN